MSKATRSIRARLVRAVVIAIFSGVFASVSFFTVHDFRNAVFAEQARLKSSAAAFAAAAADGVQAKDPRTVMLVLRGVRDLPDVMYAGAFTNQGATIAEIGQATQLVGRDGSVDVASFVTLLTANNLRASVEVRDGGEVVGTLALVANITGLRAQYLTSFGISLGVGLLLVVITAVIARYQVTRVVAPLGSLAADFADIGRRTDLTRRVAKVHDDEVGILVDAFNDMFSQIDQRDRLLQRHRETLEETIEVRTSQLRTAKDDAERANAAKSDFLATMSHEIRTPMNGMLVMAEMLSAAPLAPRHLRYAEVITRSGKALLNIINDILDFSKIEAGGISFEAIPFSLDTIIADAASLFAERAREKGLSIATYVSGDVPKTLVGDPTRLSQVIGNLVNNSLKFTETGGVSIEARCQLVASGASLEVHVRDSGVGIAPDKLGRIFERFSQADQTITRRFGGTGLGLSISRRLVEGMGGQMHVASTPSRGSDFSFTVNLDVLEPASPWPDLTGRHISIACEPILKASLIAALRERGAEISDASPELLLWDGTTASANAGIPTVYLRSFAATGAFEGREIVAEIASPMSRADLDSLCTAMIANDWNITARGAAVRDTGRLPDLRHLKVLAVDDVAVNREVLAEALSAFRITPELAASGPEAVRLFERTTFDVVFMDCSMPGMDGYEATARLRDIEKQSGRRPARILALTAHVTGHEARRWRDAGMDDYVAKPFTMAQIRSALNESADRPGPVMESTDAAPKPLLSPETLSMFNSLSGGAGNRLALKVFGLFVQHAPEAAGNLQRAVEHGSPDIDKLAHALKSMCMSAGAARTAAICQGIEQAAKDGKQNAADLAPLAASLNDTINAMQEYLQLASAA